MNKTEIERLEGWLTVPEAANVLERERARVHQIIDEGKFAVEDLRYVGGKRILLIREKAVANYKEAQDERIRLRKENNNNEEGVNNGEGTETGICGGQGDEGNV